MKFSIPKGTYDIYGAKAAVWEYVEGVIRRLCKDFRAEEIRTPIFEYTELFQRSVGETTDIVQKEMFSFTDGGGRSLTLKPEGTAGTARAYIEDGFHNLPQPVKLFYIAPSFRAERPQKGRYRQLHQFGVEVFGSYSPATDGELISLAWEFFRRLGISGLTLHINSIGNGESRKAYNAALVEYLEGYGERLCPICRDRLAKNPLRVLDCKNESCKEIVKSAPRTIDYLTDECSAHFEGVKTYLKAMDIDFVIDPGIVRGLDYYTRTVFEIISQDLGAQSTVCGGGRYDGLIEECGGSPTGAVGFGIGLDRTVIILEEQGRLPEYNPSADIFIGAMNPAALVTAVKLVYGLRRMGFSAETDGTLRSVKAQFKYADKINAQYSLMIGDTELETGKAVVKAMATGEQKEVKLEEIAGFLRNGGRKEWEEA